MTKSEMFKAAHTATRNRWNRVRRYEPRRAANMTYAAIFARELEHLLFREKTAPVVAAKFAAAETFRANHPDRWY